MNIQWFDEYLKDKRERKFHIHQEFRTEYLKQTMKSYEAIYKKI